MKKTAGTPPFEACSGIVVQRKVAQQHMVITYESVLCKAFKNSSMRCS